MKVKIPVWLYSVIIGFFAAALLFGAYTAIVTAISGSSFARTQIENNLFWLALLTVGFGTQITLFVYAKRIHEHVASGCTVASGATSGVAMLLCCTHYLATFFPLLAASGIVAASGRYQTAFFALGVVANAGGICYSVQRLWPGALRRFIPAGSIIAILLILFGVFYTASGNQKNASGQTNVSTSSIVQTEEKEISKNGITIAVTPRITGASAVFTVSINNHVVSVDEDIAKIAELTDVTGKTYAPSAWNGDPPGGHHISGELMFDSAPQGQFTLSLKQIGGIPDWQFSW